MSIRNERRLAEKEIRKHRLHLLGQTDVLHQHFDSVSKEAFSKASCHKGCSACCELLVLVSRTEADLIIERQREHITRALPELIAQAREIHELLLTLRASHDEKQILGSLTDEWWKRRRPCALLASDGSCTVYRNRPFSCRQYAVRNEPAVCASREGKQIERIVMDNAEHLTSEMERLEAYRTSLGDPTIPGGPLPMMLAEAAVRAGMLIQ